MLNLSDKELDQLSREAAEQFEPDEEISSWVKLEQQLGREIENSPPASSPPLSRVRPLGYGALILLLAGSSYFLLKTGPDSKHSTLKNQVSNQTTKQSENKVNSPEQNNNAQQQAADAANKNRPVSSTTNDRVKKSASAVENVAIDNNNHTGHAEKTNNNSVNGHLSNKNKSANNKNNTGGNKIADRPGMNINNKNNGLVQIAALETVGTKTKNGHQKSNNKNKSSQNPTNEIDGTITDPNSAASVLTGDGKSIGKNNIANSNISDKPKYAVLPDLILLDNSGADISDSSLRKIVAVENNNPPAKKNEALHIRKPLKIGIMFAPDYTNVKSASNNQASYNVGITLGYEFEDRWSVNTGLIYTAKNYAANGKDFHPSVWGVGPYTYYLDYATGSCYMLEIPLLLRYDFSRFRKTNLFVTGGLSSYLMKNQAYTYYFKNSAANPPRWKNYPGNQNYWFSIASISAGVERQIGKNFSLQAEPFIKIPLGGVGIGNLQMNSYGMIFSLRYAPVLHRSRH